MSPLITDLQELPAGRAAIVGRKDHRLDPKRRFTVPLDWFKRLGSPTDVYVTHSLSTEPCLEVFAAEDFDARMRPFRNRTLSDEKLAAFLRELSETTELLAVDTQNRIRVPDAMLAYAGLENDIVLLGSDFHFEIWSLARRPPRLGWDQARVSSQAAEAKDLKF